MPLGAFRINSLAKFTVTAVAEVIRRKVGITAIGDAKVSTAQSQFGGASYLGDGNGDYLRIHNTKNVEAVQFAWNYENPKLGLGIKSLKSECAFYKSRGFEYFYLGPADEYKRTIKGFTLLGRI